RAGPEVAQGHHRESSSLASTTTPPTGSSAASANPIRHEALSTIAANAIGATVPAIESQVCWNPSAVPLRARPASSAAAVNASPFHDIASAAEATSEGTRSASGADTSTAERATAAE